MTMSATLAWPVMAVLGFVVLTCLVVALGTSSTARYEFEHNGARERQRGHARGSHPAGSRHAHRPADGTSTHAQPQSVDLAVRPSSAAATGGPGWWLIDDSARVLAGPFADRFDADWAALADGLPADAVHGIRRGDGVLSPRPSPEEQDFYRELGDQLERLPSDWDAVLSDTDPLTTLVVEIAAALVEAGLPLQHAAQEDPAGGVGLTLSRPPAGCWSAGAPTTG